MKQITIDEYRKKNRRCRTCLYAYQPSGFNARCKAKNKSLKNHWRIADFVECSVMYMYRRRPILMAELKPCPFCGGEAILVELEYSKSAFIRCKNHCCEQELVHKTKEEALEAWNRRAEDGK